jgi:hypothetical protein
MQKLVLAAVLVALTASLGLAAKALKVYDGPWRDVADADLAVHPLKEEAYTESWFFMVQGEDDLWLFVHYGISNLQPMSDFDGVIETTVIHKGKVTFVKDNLKKDKVKYAAGALDLTLGTNTLKGGGGAYAVNVNQAGLKLDLQVKTVVPGVKPSPTRYPDGEYYAVDFAAPRAEVSGSLTLGGKAVVVKGAGYFDHSVQNFPAHKMADRLFSFRGYSADGGLNVLTFQTPSAIGGVDMPALVVMKGDKVLAKSTSLKITGTKPLADDDNDYHYPSVLQLEAKDGATPISGTITLAAKPLMMQNAADDFNFFERSLIKVFVANPMLYRHTGTFSVSVGGETVTGTGIAEVVILRE